MQNNVKEKRWTNEWINSKIIFKFDEKFTILSYSNNTRFYVSIKNGCTLNAFKLHILPPKKMHNKNETVIIQLLKTRCNNKDNHFLINLQFMPNNRIAICDGQQQNCRRLNWGSLRLIIIHYRMELNKFLTSWIHLICKHTENLKKKLKTQQSKINHYSNFVAFLWIIVWCISIIAQLLLKGIINKKLLQSIVITLIKKLFSPHFMGPQSHPILLTTISKSSSYKQIHSYNHHSYRLIIVSTSINI